MISFMLSITNNYSKEKLTINENNKLKEIAQRTWKYFDDYMNETNHFLPPEFVLKLFCLVGDTLFAHYRMYIFLLSRAVSSIN